MEKMVVTQEIQIRTHWPAAGGTTNAPEVRSTTVKVRQLYNFHYTYDVDSHKAARQEAIECCESHDWPVGMRDGQEQHHHSQYHHSQ